MKKNLIFLIFIIVSIFCYAQDLYFPPIDSSDWETLSPDSLGWCADSLESLNNFLDEKSSKAFMILKNGKIVVEWYYDDFTADSLWYWASASKSMTAFLIGIAQEEGYLDIDDLTSDYLGTGWSVCPPEKEQLITIKHQLSMATGLNDNVPDPDCTDPECLQYLSDAGNRWAYHNAPYNLLRNIIESATGMSLNLYTLTRLSNYSGINGIWFNIDYNTVFFSKARSMARFGLLILNNGYWEDYPILNDPEYFNQIINTSQEFNFSYGYLWWLNGKGSYMLPGSQFVFNTNLIPEAPDDLIAALGKDDQKIYIVPSLELVVIRMGDSAGQQNWALSSFDNLLWQKIMNLDNNVSTYDETINSDLIIQNFPNPFNPSTNIRYTIKNTANVVIEIYNAKGQKIKTFVEGEKNKGEYQIYWNGLDSKSNPVSSGIYFFKMKADNYIGIRKGLLLK